MRLERRGSTPVERGFQSLTWAPLQEPVDPTSDVIFSRFAGDACNRLSRLIQDKGAGDDIAQTFVSATRTTGQDLFME
jgi:hypothetical protein